MSYGNFKDSAICRGSVALGSGCRTCVKCLKEMARFPKFEDSNTTLNAIEKSAVKIVAVDSNVEKNRELLLQRSQVGFKKYGCTTENLTLRQSLQHALEEVLDLANYLQQAISELDNSEDCGK